MARTTQQIIEDLLGKKDMQIAALTAALEDSQEKADALQKALDGLAQVPTVKLKRAEPRPLSKDDEDVIAIVKG